MKRDIFILEFSERQQVFHMNYGQHPENTYGWQTIAKGEDNYISVFIDYIEDRYKFNKKKPIKLRTVEREFKAYELLIAHLKRRFNVDRKW
jgi:hypothetical protein